MRVLVEMLFAAQETLRRQAPGSAEHRLALQRLRQEMPAPMLAHFLRFVAEGRRGVAQVRHGVCSECHLRVASGVVAALVKPKDVHMCENCGCYLLLDLTEMPNAPVRLTPTAAVVRKPRPQASVVQV